MNKNQVLGPLGVILIPETALSNCKKYPVMSHTCPNVSLVCPKRVPTKKINNINRTLCGMYVYFGVSQAYKCPTQIQGPIRRVDASYLFSCYCCCLPKQTLLHVIIN